MPGQSVGAVYVDAILNNKKFNNQVSDTVKGAERSFTSSFGKIGAAIGAALSVAAVTAFAKSCVDAAMQAESAFMGLNSQLSAQGKSFSEAKSFLEEYVSDGLVPMTNAANAYKQLASRGFDDKQIRDMMNATKDMATYNRQAHYSMGEAVEVFAQGLKNEDSTLTDSAGMTKNLSVIWDEYAQTIGKTGATLTQTEKVQAEYLATMNEWQYSMGNAATMSNTFAGRLTRLKATFTSIKTEIGNVIIPIVDLFMPAIQAAANAVLNFIVRIKQLLSLFGLEMQEIGGGTGAAETIQTGMDAAADSAGAAADAIGSTGKAATAAAKAVKRALAPYDELNKLTFAKDSSGSGGSGGGVGGAGSDADITDTSIAVTETESAIEEMALKGSKYLALLSKGFTDAFGNTNFEGIKAHIKGIGDTIKEVFGDSAVKDAAQGVVDSMMYAFGSMAGAVARIGTNIVEGFVGAIDYGLDAVKEDLKARFVRLFDGFSMTFDLSASIWQSLGEISDIFASDEAKRLGGELLACLIIQAGMLWQFAVDTTNGLFQAIEQALRENKGAIKVSLTDLLDFGGDLLQPIREAFQGIADAYDAMYQEHLAPAFDSFAQGWSDFIGGFLDVWNTNGKPILDEIGSIWDEFITGDLGPAFEKLIDAGGKVIGFFGELWETIGGKTGEALGDGLVSFAEIAKNAFGGVADVLGLVADLGGSAFEVIGGAIETITGIFEGFNSGDWSGIGDGLKSIASGLGNIIDAILEFIGVDFDLTDWVGSWTKKGGDILKNLASGMGSAKAIVTKKWNEVKGWFSDIKKTASVSITQKWSSISKKWSDLTKNIKDKTASMKARIGTSWNNLKGSWNNITKNIKDKTASMKAKIGTTWSSLKGKWNSLIKNFKDKTVTVTLKIKSVISDMKAWVNSNVIKKINKYVPFVKIPYLAQGGWLPANAPQLAVVGDNRREGEIVAPESKIREQVKQAISELGGGMMGTIRVEIAMPDGRVIAKEINRAQMAAGKVLLNV